jgi:hypothetical protein
LIEATSLVPVDELALSGAQAEPRSPFSSLIARSTMLRCS